MEIFEMTIKDLEIIKENLQRDFDEFWNENILREELLCQDRKYIVVKESNEILGFAGIWISPTDVELMNIVIKKDKRNKGIGKKILDEIINLAKSTNLEYLTLEVNEKNVIACKLYKNAGFNVIGIRKKYYNNTDNAIIMKLDLKNNIFR